MKKRVNLKKIQMKKGEMIKARLKNELVWCFSTHILRSEWVGRYFFSLHKIKKDAFFLKHAKTVKKKGQNCNKIYMWP